MPVAGVPHTEASSPHRCTIVSTGSVTRLATTVVVPRCRWNRAAALTSSGSVVANDAPPPPWQCTSTSPGSTVPIGAGSPGAAGRTARTRAPSSSTTASSSTSSPSTTRPRSSVTRPR